MFELLLLVKFSGDGGVLFGRMAGEPSAPTGEGILPGGEGCGILPGLVW